MNPWVQGALLALGPAGAQWLAERVRGLRAVGPVGLAYALGFFVANQPVLPVDAELALAMAQVSALLAIPLLLFGLDLGALRRLGRPLIASFLVAAVSAVIVALVAGKLAAADPAAASVAAMLTGVYVGGTANMAAVGMALDVPAELFVVVNAADFVLGGAYFFFLLSLAGPLYARFLPRASAGADAATGMESVPPRRAAGALAAAAMLVGAGAAVGLAVEGPARDPLVLLVITSGAIALALVPRLRWLAAGRGAGDYILLVFCASMGATADIGKLLAADLGYVALTAEVMLGAVLLHLAVSRWLGFDRDVVIIASTATIFGPAFIGPVATALGNRALVPGGILLALAGFALGNYAGLLVAWLLGA